MELTRETTPNPTMRLITPCAGRRLRLAPGYDYSKLTICSDHASDIALRRAAVRLAGVPCEGILGKRGGINAPMFRAVPEYEGGGEMCFIAPADLAESLLPGAFYKQNETAEKPGLVAESNPLRLEEPAKQLAHDTRPGHLVPRPGFNPHHARIYQGDT